MSEVKRYSAKVKGDPHYWDMVFASDYDALQSRLDAAEAECERLESLIKQYARRMCAAEDDLSALKAQQAGQEPVAWRMWNGKTWRFCYSDLHGKRGWEPLMTVAQHERILASWQRAQSAPAGADERDILLAEARMVIAACLSEGDFDAELSWMAERASKGRRIYIDDRALAAAPQPAPQQGDEVRRLREAVAEFFEAKQAKDDFERENPGNSTKRWDSCLCRVEAAEDAMRAAMSAQGVGERT